MAFLGLSVVWVGYTLSYFGFCSLRGPGVGLLDLAIPGRTVVVPTSGNPGGAAPAGSSDQEQWIKDHPGQLPHPGAGPHDFWNAISQMGGG